MFGVRAVADSLLCRLQHAGPAGRGKAAATKRRAEAIRRGERKEGERSSSAVAHPRLPGPPERTISPNVNVLKSSLFLCDTETLHLFL